MPIYRSVILGQRNAGKTSLIKTLAGEKIADDYKPTKDDWITVKLSNSTRMRCYDIGGYGENVPLQELYVAMAQLVIVVWDSSNQDSIEMAQSILQDIKGHPSVIVVATKADIGITTETDQNTFCGYPLITTSSKSKTNIEKMQGVMLTLLQESKPPAVLNEKSRSASRTRLIANRVVKLERTSTAPDVKSRIRNKGIQLGSFMRPPPLIIEGEAEFGLQHRVQTRFVSALRQVRALF